MNEYTYPVLKHKDIALFLNKVEQEELIRMQKKIAMFRKYEGKEALSGLFVNKQWYIYQQIEDILIHAIDNLQEE